MNDEGARGPQLGRDLELVRPAPVVGHRVAAENLFVRRVVDQHEQDLAPHVDILEIIPVVLRRGRAVAHEDELAVQINLLHDPCGRGDVVRARFEDPGLTSASNREGAAFGWRDADQGDLLNPGAVRVTRNQPEHAELLGEVGDRLFLTRRAWRASFKFIRCQRSHMLQQRAGVDALYPIAARLRGRLPGRTLASRDEEQETQDLKPRRHVASILWAAKLGAGTGT